MAAMSGAAIPAALADQLTAAADDPDLAFRIGVDHAVTVCERLLEGGAPGLHFFTMNRATSTLQVCEQLGWTPISHR